MLVIKYNVCHYIVAGDFNTDLSRNNSQHTSSLCEFLDDNNCEIMTNVYSDNINYTYTCAGDTSIQSVIDHIIVSKPLNECVSSYQMFDNVDNISDHVALVCSFEIPTDYTKLECKVSDKHINWKKASDCDIHAY